MSFTFGPGESSKFIGWGEAGGGASGSQSGPESEGEGEECQVQGRPSSLRERV